MFNSSSPADSRSGTSCGDVSDDHHDGSSSTETEEQEEVYEEDPSSSEQSYSGEYGSSGERGQVSYSYCSSPDSSADSRHNEAVRREQRRVLQLR